MSNENNNYLIMVDLQFTLFMYYMYHIKINIRIKSTSKFQICIVYNIKKCSCSFKIVC